MKELSIEKKAKRYDKAIERAEGLIDFCSDSELKTLEYVFPELKESEDDEKIRKGIISGMKALQEKYKCTEFAHIPMNDVFTWLEKQEEKKPTLPKWKYKNDNTPLLRDSLILNKYGCVAKSPSGAFVNDVWVIDYDELAKLPKEELEKQGEQETLCDKCRKEHPSHSCQDITELGRCSVEHEQKSDNSYCQENCRGFQETGKCFADGDCKAKREAETIDKFKPKFKPGDWITDGCLHCKIIEVLDECYIVDTKFGKSAITFKREYNYHLWSIQDARDGDILAGSKDEVILIFRGIGNTEWDDVIDYHCYYDCYREEIIVQEKLGFWGNVDDTELKPSTKKQRDLLFKKMEESGYEFDFEKKELKEIEQKSYGQRKECLDCQFNYAGECEGSCHMKREEQKPVWSEEDERLCLCLIKDQKEALDEVRNDKYGHSEIISDLKEMYRERIDWLKSLKQRIGG